MNSSDVIDINSHESSQINLQKSKTIFRDFNSMDISLHNVTQKAGKTDSSGEKVLIGYKAFSGNCRYCGKLGDKAKDCFKKHDEGKGNNLDLDKNGKDKSHRGFNGTCHHCGKKGHKKADCFQLNEKKPSTEKRAEVLVAEVYCENIDGVVETETRTWRPRV
jgi:Zinc knuckle